MMFGWTRSKREKEQRKKGRRSLRPARLGLLVFVLACLGIVYWDISYQGNTGGGLTLEQPVVNVEAVAEIAGAEEEGGKEEEDWDGETAAAEDDPAGGEAEALFAAYRLERESSRDEELALLQEIIDDPSSTEAARQDAERRKLEVASAIENESAAESLLRAKDFGETVVLVSGEQATVICDLELTAASAGQIAAVVAECCGVSFENVIIVNR